jgi:hypothetical protein
MHRQKRNSGRCSPCGDGQQRPDWIAGHGVCEQRAEERWGFDGDDIQTCTGTAKRKGNNETNAMVCSPSAKDERRRRKSSPELERSSPESGKMTEATSDSRD